MRFLKRSLLSSTRFIRFRFLCREDTVHKNIATIWDVLHKPWDLIKVKLSSSWFLNDEIRHSCLRNLTNWVFLSLWWFWVQDHLNNAVLTLIKVKMSSDWIFEQKFFCFDFWLASGKANRAGSQHLPGGELWKMSKILTLRPNITFGLFNFAPTVGYKQSLMSSSSLFRFQTLLVKHSPKFWHR